MGPVVDDSGKMEEKDISYIKQLAKRWELSFGRTSRIPSARVSRSINPINSSRLVNYRIRVRLFRRNKWTFRWGLGSELRVGTLWVCLRKSCGRKQEPKSRKRKRRGGIGGKRKEEKREEKRSNRRSSGSLEKIGQHMLFPSSVRWG